MDAPHNVESSIVDNNDEDITAVKIINKLTQEIRVLKNLIFDGSDDVTHLNQSLTRLMNEVENVKAAKNSEVKKSKSRLFTELCLYADYIDGKKSLEEVKETLGPQFEVLKEDIDEQKEVEETENEHIIKLVELEGKINHLKESTVNPDVGNSLLQIMIELDAIKSNNEVIMYKQKALMYEISTMDKSVEMPTESHDINNIQEFEMSIKAIIIELDNIRSISEADFIRIDAGLSSITLQLNKMPKQNVPEVKKIKKALMKKIRTSFNVLENKPRSEQSVYWEVETEEVQLAKAEIIKKLQLIADYKIEADELKRLIFEGSKDMEDLDELLMKLTNKADKVRAMKNVQVKKAKIGLNAELKLFAQYIDGKKSLGELKSAFVEEKKEVNSQKFEAAFKDFAKQDAIDANYYICNIRRICNSIKNRNDELVSVENSTTFFEIFLNSNLKSLLHIEQEILWSEEDTKIKEDFLEVKKDIFNFDQFDIVNNDKITIKMLKLLRLPSINNSLQSMLNYLQAIFFAKSEILKLQLKCQYLQRDIEKYVEDLTIFKYYVFEQLHDFLDVLN